MILELYDKDGRQVVGGDAYEIILCGLLGRDKLTVNDAQIAGCRIVIVGADGARIEETLAPSADFFWSLD